MKKCRYCNAEVLEPVSYCPHCGQLIPGCRHVNVVEKEELERLRSSHPTAASEGKIYVDKEKATKEINAYNDLVRNGYAPSGKHLLSKDEHKQLQESSYLLERWKKERERRIHTPIFHDIEKKGWDVYGCSALVAFVLLVGLIFLLFWILPWVCGLFSSSSQKPKAGIEIVFDEKTGKYGIMNHRLDSLVTPCVYDTIIHASYNGKWDYYRLEKNGLLNIADNSGVRTISDAIDSIKCVTESDVILLFKGGKQGLMTHNGQPILDAVFYRVLWDNEPPYKSMYSPGRYIGNIIPAKRYKDIDWKLYNRNGDLILDVHYPLVSQVCHPNLIKVGMTYNRWGLINDKGKVILPCSYYYIYMYSEDLAWVKKSYSKNDLWICISSKGEKLGILPSEYSPIGAFHSGLSAVSYREATYGSHIGYCNAKGEIVIPAKFGYYTTQESSHGSSHLIRYVSSPFFQGDSALVSYQGKNGVLRKDGTFKPRE